MESAVFMKESTPEIHKKDAKKSFSFALITISTVITSYSIHYTKLYETALSIIDSDIYSDYSPLLSILFIFNVDFEIIIFN